MEISMDDGATSTLLRSDIPFVPFDAGTNNQNISEVTVDVTAGVGETVTFILRVRATTPSGNFSPWSDWSDPETLQGVNPFVLGRPGKPIHVPQSVSAQGAMRAFKAQTEQKEETTSDETISDTSTRGDTDTTEESN